MMLLDTIMIFLNVLEQFAIRASIFDFDVENIYRYVNKLYFNNNEIFESLLKNSSNINTVEPKLLITESIKDMDKNLSLDFSKSQFEKIGYTLNTKSYILK